MFNVKQFGIYLSRLRKNAGMTQARFAERLSVTRQAVSKYETGESFPDVSILIKIAEIFGVTLDALIKSGETSKSAEISEKFISDGVDISRILSLVEYINGGGLSNSKNPESPAENGALSEYALEKLIPFLDSASKEAIVSKIIDGECDWRLLKVIIPYVNDMTMQIEAAYMDGALPKEAFDIINEYAKKKIFG